ncbi:DUF6203 family protein [Nonomuraea sp. NPDC001023]|uniref:DUF6203 family protein n=1 Tax=unclassified Nonomuraea TaxID=2593643 RepID=UPI00331A6E90
MRKFMKIFVARWLARTPWGLAIMAAAYLLGRRRRRAGRPAGRPTGRRRARREPAHHRR